MQVSKTMSVSTHPRESSMSDARSTWRSCYRNFCITNVPVLLLFADSTASWFTRGERNYQNINNNQGRKWTRWSPALKYCEWGPHQKMVARCTACSYRGANLLLQTEFQCYQCFKKLGITLKPL